METDTQDNHLFYKRDRPLHEALRLARDHALNLDDWSENPQHYDELYKTLLLETRATLDRYLLEIAPPPPEILLLGELTPYELSDIEAVANNATREPWELDEELVSPAAGLLGRYDYVVHRFREGDTVTVSGSSQEDTFADAEFIAEAREIIPLLLQEIKRLKAWATLDSSNYNHPPLPPRPLDRKEYRRKTAKGSQCKS